MHIHPAAIAQHAINISAAGSDRAAVAHRTAEVRKRLLNSAGTGVDSDPDATLLVGQWLDSRHSQVLSGDEYHSAASGKDPDLG